MACRAVLVKDRGHIFGEGGSGNARRTRRLLRFGTAGQSEADNHERGNSMGSAHEHSVVSIQRRCRTVAFCVDSRPPHELSIHPAIGHVTRLSADARRTAGTAVSTELGQRVGISGKSPPSVSRPASARPPHPRPAVLSRSIGGALVSAHYAARWHSMTTNLPTCRLSLAALLLPSATENT